MLALHSRTGEVLTVLIEIEAVVKLDTENASIIFPFCEPPYSP